MRFLESKNYKVDDVDLFNLIFKKNEQQKFLAPILIGVIIQTKSAFSESSVL